jgi:membrane protein YdbS with pleckstrin-like domain
MRILYYIIDMVIGIIHYKKIGDPFTLAHHLVSTYAFVYVLTLNVMPYFANFRLLAELSTPLVNIR